MKSDQNKLGEITGFRSEVIWKFEVINETEGDIPAYTVEAKGRDGESITVEVSPARWIGAVDDQLPGSKAGS